MNGHDHRRIDLRNAALVGAAWAAVLLIVAACARAESCRSRLARRLRVLGANPGRQPERSSMIHRLTAAAGARSRRR